MKYRTNFFDYGCMFNIWGELLGRRQGLRWYVKRRSHPPTPRIVIHLKRRLKLSFPWKRVKPMQFGKYAVRVPYKIKR